MLDTNLEFLLTVKTFITGIYRVTNKVTVNYSDDLLTVHSIYVEIYQKYHKIGEIYIKDNGKYYHLYNYGACASADFDSLVDCVDNLMRRHESYAKSSIGF